MEDVATELEVVEPEMETIETVVDDMSDTEFAEHFDKVDEDGTDTDGDDITNDSDDKPTDDVDLNTLYSEQLGDADAKLDKPILIKVDGEVIKLDTINDLRDMAERGTSVTKKFQKLADDRRVLEAQLQALGETPDVVDESGSEIDSIANGILQSSYADDFKSSVSQLPSEVRETLSTNPQVLKGLSLDFESGLAQQIMPQVKREMTVKGLDFIQAYVSVGQKLESSKASVQKQRQVLKSEPKQTSHTTSVVDVDGMSQSDFDKYFESL